MTGKKPPLMAPPAVAPHPSRVGKSFFLALLHYWLQSVAFEPHVSGDPDRGHQEIGARLQLRVPDSAKGSDLRNH